MSAIERITFSKSISLSFSTSSLQIVISFLVFCVTVRIISLLLVTSGNSDWKSINKNENSGRKKYIYSFHKQHSAYKYFHGKMMIKLLWYQIRFINAYYFWKGLNKLCFHLLLLLDELKYYCQQFWRLSRVTCYWSCNFQKSL